MVFSLGALTRCTLIHFRASGIRGTLSLSRAGHQLGLNILHSGCASQTSLQYSNKWPHCPDGTTHKDVHGRGFRLFDCLYHAKLHRRRRENEEGGEETRKDGHWHSREHDGVKIAAQGCSNSRSRQSDEDVRRTGDHALAKGIKVKKWTSRVVERWRELRDDPDAEIWSAHQTLCKGCNQVVVDRRGPYRLCKWKKHKERCPRREDLGGTQPTTRRRSSLRGGGQNR
ncbi:hypothetical protein C8F04DRAFT_1098294 [Mycena alexandri]|uniref:Uncharacterized protein n=1 Tax=Mycena alexandri TaxID=1745969 RepID=A0AAD6X3K5_9AGAR|nr:hypothetical protein C8F04DRAFT_1098294 [Mycena alexandri]